MVGIVADRLVGTEPELVDGDPAVVEPVGLRLPLPVPGVDEWMVSVTSLVLVIVTSVVTSAVLLASPSLDRVSVDMLLEVGVVSETCGLLARVVFVAMVLLNVSKVEELDWLAEFVSIVDDVDPVTSALEAVGVG